MGPEGVSSSVLFWNWPPLLVAVSARDAGAHKDSSLVVALSRAIADRGLPTSSPQMPSSPRQILLAVAENIFKPRFCFNHHLHRFLP